MKKYKVVHITTKHPRVDSRIFYKQCSSLAKFYDCTLIVNDGKPNEYKNIVNIVNIVNSNLFLRKIVEQYLIFKYLNKYKPDIIQIHDPELFGLGILLKVILRAKVIIDLHEDYESVIEDRKFNSFKKILVLGIYEIFKKIIIKYDYIICATDHIESKVNIKNKEIIYNYPIYKTNNADLNAKKSINLGILVYVGSISIDRGIIEMLSILGQFRGELRLKLIGKIDSDSLKKMLFSNVNWKYVDYIGEVDHEDVSEHLSNGGIGLCLLKDTKNYYNSYPIKLFEYFAHGMPVVASNFPSISLLMNDLKFGKVVEPSNINSCTQAIKEIMADSSYYRKNQEKTKELILTKYSWASEELKLLKVYEKVLDSE